MLWTFTTAAGSYLYIVLMIIPHVIVSLFSRTGNLPHILARSWARFTLLCSGARVELRGRENIPDGPAVYMANHVSHFDVFAILGHLDIQFRWTVKKELYTIPLLGLAMRRAGYIMIDRSNHEKAVRSLKTAAEKIRNGTSIVIFPEGTRSCDGRLQYPFKKGGFHLAMESGVPIVPITVVGSHEVLPKHGKRVKPGKIVLNMGKPIASAGSSMDALMEEVYNSIKLGYTL
ncbi:MAG: 1-acyl-sn-glycerol-3-phosphate acyltransferase [Deltaproteobacteria bacterium ADurb.BinA179]|jgi:1-acyl-sn-glycerol-3-phosphate acyltransferase|nr:lysophospholipid acyltransferase family protein [Pseudomonadota bacterium]OPZ29347.1 MAG: 1-acyl-sn-glycerol-3-phosphate acyltransferase [Deltaproteobacteria bacterium ADurb.BinA179]HOD69399.1 lysophospholipid acyltransferase family protein [Deltaproteobacteria bacterium]HRR22228.1 lysophospholipid acyltransferase family protein [Desulfomonilia bacterium]HON60327.1 lysophospholipid acyltransferase family protein [Deltaproteobacteria bacterium]